MNQLKLPQEIDFPTAVSRLGLVQQLTDISFSPQIRDGYKILLRLSLAYLTGQKATIPKPGAIHHARWMTKAICGLITFLYMAQLPVTQSEKKKRITKILIFYCLYQILVCDTICYFCSQICYGNLPSITKKAFIEQESKI